MSDLHPDTINLLQGILETLRQTKADRERANALLVRCQCSLTDPVLGLELTEYLGDTTSATAEEEADALIQTLV